MTLSTVAQRYQDSSVVPCGIAADIGTGGPRIVMYNLLTGEYLGDPISADCLPEETSHKPPRIQMNATTMLQVYRDTFRRVVEEQLPKNGVIKAIANDGHMHAGALMEGLGFVGRPMQMWNSPASQKEGEFLRKSLGWMVPDRTTVAQLLWAFNEPSSDFASKFRIATTAAGLVGFRLTKNHGLDYCEHSGLGINNPATGELAKEIEPFLDGKRLLSAFPNRLEPNKILGVVTPEGAAWLGVEYDLLKECVVAAPAGDQGAGRDGLGCDERHAGLVLGSSIVVSTETEARPDGWQWTEGSAGACFDPFMSPHGRYFNMGMVNTGMRAMDPFINGQLKASGGKARNVIFRGLGEAASKLSPDYNSEFYARFDGPDPSLGVSRAYDSGGDHSPALRYLLMIDQVAASVRRRLEALCPLGALPSQLVVGGSASKDDILLQLLANGIGVDLLRPSGADFASLNGMIDRGRLAEEIFGRIPTSSGLSVEDARAFMRELRPAPSGDEFKADAAGFAKRKPYRDKLAELLVELAS